MDKSKGGRPVNQVKTTQKILRVPDDILDKAQEKARKNGLNFQQYAINLIAKDVNSE